MEHTRTIGVVIGWLLALSGGGLGGTPTAPTQAPTYTITDLGFNAYETGATAISSNGLVVGGWAQGGAFLWEEGMGMRDLGKPDPRTRARPVGVNDSGWVVAAILGHGFTEVGLYRDGEWTRIPYARRTDPRGMNNAGQIIATARVPTFRAVLYEDGVWTNLGTLPGDTASGATAINGTGQVVGYSSRHGGQRSFLWHRDTGMVDLALPVASSSATAISETGEIAGSFTIGNSSDQHPYVYRDGSMMDLGTLPGDPGAEAAGVNSLGQVVGTSGSGDPFRPRHAFLWQEDLGLVDLNDLIPRGVGWELQHATAINDAGQIVGYGRIGGQTHAFRLDAVVPIKTHRR